MQSHALAGFLGGLASSVALQPLDLLKTRAQQGGTSGVAASLRSLRSVADAWRGTLPSVIRTSIGAGMYLSLLSRIRAARAISNDRLSSNLPRLSPVNNVLTGAFARATIGFIMMPITVIKVRFESNLYSYRTIREAAADIVRTQGWRGLFSGYVATASRDAPYAGLYMLFYDKAKDMLQLGWLPGPVINTIAASSAAVMASTATAPFDTVKTRVQLAPRHQTVRQTWADIVRPGWRSLFDGLSLRLTRKVFSAGISWCIYEELVKHTT